MNTTVPSVTAVDPQPLPPSASRPRAIHPTFAFRAVFRKTLTETKFIGMGLWVFAIVVLVITTYDASDGYTKPFHPRRHILMDQEFGGLFSGACITFGCLLGLFQFRTLNSFEQWALHVHRPIMRSRLFACHALAGLSLYVIAVGVPLSAFLIWAVNDSEATPYFFPRMLLPHLANFVAGTVGYFAGLLLMLRQNRWRGVRLLIILGAVLAYVASLMLPSFSLMLAMEMVAIVIFAGAAWGAFLSHGLHVGIPRIGRAAFLATLLAGCLFGAMFIGLMSVATGLHYIQQGAVPPSKETEHSITRPVVLSDGHIARKTYFMWYIHSNGELQNSPKFFTSLSGEKLSGVKEMAMESANPWPKLQQVKNTSYRELAYSENSLQLLPPLPPGFSLPVGETLRAVNNWNAGRNVPWTTVTTSRHAYIFDRDRQAVVVTIPLQSSHLEYMSLTTSATRDFFVVRYYDSLRSQWSAFLGPVLGRPEPESTTRLEVYDKSGNLIQTYAGLAQVIEPPFPDAFARNPGYRHIGFLTGMGQAVGMYLTFLPLGDRLGIHWLPPERMPWSIYNFVGALTMSLVTAVLMFLLARRCYLSRGKTGIWMLAGFVFGPLMLLAYIAFYRCPLRTKCPACGKPRPVNKTNCPRCAAPFPAPPPNGTEIFA